MLEHPHFPLAFNGTLHGYFKGQRGLRQGDPISPLLFVLSMEYMPRIFTRIGEHKFSRFHPRCKSLNLNHLVFADDLIVFSRGEVVSINLIMRGLATFTAPCGLIVNSEKSNIQC